VLLEVPRRRHAVRARVLQAGIELDSLRRTVTRGGRRLDVTMSRLRRKLGAPPVIENTPGVGYRIAGLPDRTE